MNQYVKIRQIGSQGKDGTVYLVLDKDTGEEYAMKTYKPRKSSNMIRKEVEFHLRAAEIGVAPKIIKYSLSEKFIVMELMERTLMDILSSSKGKLTVKQQKEILRLFAKLDEIGVVHNDANPLNIMERNKRLYLIDYGFAKDISHPQFKKYPNPNTQLMPVGLLVWMKNRYDTSEWKEIRKSIPESILQGLSL